MGPDLDAVSSVWTLKKFDAEHFDEAEVAFVPSGNRIPEAILANKGIKPEEVVHVDTGGGRFDHHTEDQALADVCAASLCRDYVIEIHPELEDDEALARMSRFAVEIDHFGEINWPDANADRFLYQLDEIIKNLKTVGLSDAEVVEFSHTALNSVYSAFKIRVAAEEEVDEGQEFDTKWGRGLALLTANDEVIKYAQKRGYTIVVRKDPEMGHIRIKAVPGKKIDLTEIYEKIVELDAKATWFLHPAKTMLLNGSRKHQGQVASKLALSQVVEIIKK